MPGIPSLYILIAGVAMFVLLLLYALRNYVYDAVMFLRDRWKFIAVFVFILVAVFFILNYKPPPAIIKPGIYISHTVYG